MMRRTIKKILALNLAILTCSSITTVRANDLISFQSAAFEPGDKSYASVQADDGKFLFPLHFTAETDRLLWDVSINPPDSKASSIAIDYQCDDPGAIRAITLHLQDNGHWLTAAAASFDSGPGTLVFNRSSFRPESGAPDWGKATQLRISFWKNAQRPAEFILMSLRSYTPSIGIIQGSELTAPGETALSARCTARAVRLFERAGITAAVLDDKLEGTGYENLKWIVLPYNPKLNRSQINHLESFVKKQNGRLAVFYSSNQKLARLLNTKPLSYASQSLPWTTVEFDSTSITNLPSTMPHHTGHLLPVKGDGKSSRTTGYWLSHDGFPDPAMPASAQSPQGFWFSHIPPLATPAASQWLLANLAACDDSFRPQLELFITKSQARDEQARVISAETRPAPGLLRGVWADAVPARLRESTMQNLASNGINAVFEHVATAGFIRERTEGGFTAAAEGSKRAAGYIENIKNIAGKYNIELHAWIIIMNAESLPPEVLAKLKKENRLMVDPEGKTIPWLCPSHPANRTMLLEMTSTLAASGVAGIHLDYIRYPERRGCFSKATQQAFEKRLGRPVENWPAPVLPGGELAAQYDQFRLDEITSLVKAIRNEVRRASPGIKLSAAVYPTAESAKANGQDWPEWLKQNLLSFACPMLYTGSTAQFKELLAAAVTHADTPAKIIPGIGVTADESQLDALSTAEQIKAARQHDTGGFILFGP